MEETFIQHKDLLLTRFEYYGGDAPAPKVNAARHKLVAKGQARIIQNEREWDPKEAKKIVRKK